LTESENKDIQSARPFKPGSNTPFLVGLVIISAVYIFLIVAMLVADATFTSPAGLMEAIASREIRYAIKLSLISCSLTTILSLWVAVPIGYLMSRRKFPFKGVVDAILDIPIVLPPLVIGLSLLIMFQSRLGQAIESVVPVTYALPSVILAQFMIACAFAVRTMRITFEDIGVRQEQVALTLGANQSQAFWRVVMPQARNGLVTAATIAWARSLGEFGPILLFSGATRMRTEVLPTTVFLELSVGNIDAAVAVSLIMVIAAVIVLGIARIFGTDSVFGKVVGR
jgi:molybdate transport system permease protein